jgi:hypothetical protein
VVLQDIGLGLSYVQAFGLESATDDGLYTFGTNWNQLWVGLSYRFRLWDARDRPPVLNVSGRYGFVNFTLEPEDDLARTIENEVPSVEYQLLRLGVDLRFPFGKIVALWPSFGVVGALQGGPVYERFTDAELACIDLGLQGVFAIDAGFEIRTGIEYTRFFAAFDPQVNDAYVAGGALDQLIALRAGAAYVY